MKLTINHCLYMAILIGLMMMLATFLVPLGSMHEMIMHFLQISLIIVLLYGIKLIKQRREKIRMSGEADKIAGWRLSKETIAVMIIFLDTLAFAFLLMMMQMLGLI